MHQKYLLVTFSFFWSGQALEQASQVVEFHPWKRSKDVL